jgi:hypothetical protein
MRRRQPPMSRREREMLWQMATQKKVWVRIRRSKPRRDGMGHLPGV